MLLNFFHILFNIDHLAKQQGQSCLKFSNLGVEMMLVLLFKTFGGIS